MSERERLIIDDGNQCSNKSQQGEEEDGREFWQNANVRAPNQSWPEIPMPSARRTTTTRCLLPIDLPRGQQEIHEEGMNGWLDGMNPRPEKAKQITDLRVFLFSSFARTTTNTSGPSNGELLFSPSLSPSSSRSLSLSRTAVHRTRDAWPIRGYIMARSSVHQWRTWRQAGGRPGEQAFEMWSRGEERWKMEE